MGKAISPAATEVVTFWNEESSPCATGEASRERIILMQYLGTV
jgi:hypothetical protein